MMANRAFSRNSNDSSARDFIRKLADKHGGGADVTVGDGDYVSTLMTRLAACGAPQSVPGYPAGGGYPGQCPPQGGGGYPMTAPLPSTVTCGRQPFVPIPAAGLAAAVAGGAASGIVSATPKVPMKAYRLIVPGGVNWRITSLQVGLREYIGSTIGVSAFVFADQEATSGLLDLDWANPALPINSNATNITGGALDYNPVFYGVASSS